MSNQPASGCVTQNDRIIEYSALCSAVIHFESIIYLFIMPHISNTAFKVQSSTLVEKKVFFLFVYALCCISKQTLIKPTLYLNRELNKPHRQLTPAFGPSEETPFLLLLVGQAVRICLFSFFGA